MAKVALITGATGQDGSYLIDLLLSKDYDVHVLRQPSSLYDLDHIEKVLPLIHLHYGDMTDGTSIHRIISNTKPDEIYNLAAQSHVQVSFDTPEYTAQVNGIGVLRFLEAIKTLNPDIKFFQASTSELFGDSQSPQDELTPMDPQSPYAAAKRYAYDLVRMYRKAYGLFACNGIMFNHESCHRGENFVTRKIAVSLGKIMRGEMECMYLGNLDAKRDWSHAEDIMRGAWMIMNHEKADDFVLASGTSNSIRDFAKESFRLVGIGLEWKGSGTEEVGYDLKTGRILVAVDPVFFRPLEVEDLRGDYTKAKMILDWQPQRDFKSIVREMVEAETVLKNDLVNV